KIRRARGERLRAQTLTLPVTAQNRSRRRPSRCAGRTRRRSRAPKQRARARRASMRPPFVATFTVLAGASVGACHASVDAAATTPPDSTATTTDSGSIADSGILDVADADAGADAP